MAAGETWDLIIVGGGPAGAAAAIRARDFGLDTLVLEAERFPREHIGESLVYLWSQFELLGVSEQMDAEFQHKYGSCRVWGREPELKWTRFQGSAERLYSLQVDRRRFDAILLDRARAVGAAVREEHPVTEVLWREGRAVGVRYRNPQGEIGEARASWVIDASGRAGLIARQKRLRRIDRFFPDLSVYGYFRGASRFDGENAGNLLIEAVPWGWLWFIPLANGDVSVGLVCDASTRPRLKRLGMSQYFRTALDQSSIVRQRLSEAALVRGPFGTASGGYASTYYAGPGWLTTGDAASFIDPMWATGIANALLDGILAAAVVEAASSARITEPRLIAHYDKLLRRRAEFVLNLVKFVYRANRLHADEPFWTRRHQAAALDEAAVERAMHRLSREPSIRYFRQAFGGMGVDRRSLAPLDRFLARVDANPRPSAPMLMRPGSWIPERRGNVALYPSLGMSKDHTLVDGTAAEQHGVVEFTSSSTAGEALRLADGSLTVDQIATRLSERAPIGRRVLSRFQALATLAQACDRELISLRPAAPH